MDTSNIGVADLNIVGGMAILRPSPKKVSASKCMHNESTNNDEDGSHKRPAIVKSNDNFLKCQGIPLNDL